MELEEIDVQMLWLEIWKSHQSYQKWLTIEQSVVAEEEMVQELEECVARLERTFGDRNE